MSHDVYAILRDTLSGRRTFIVTDRNVERLVMPGLSDAVKGIGECPAFAISPGEENKTIRTVEGIWRWLMENGATRQDLLLNIGGGMVCDTGGFAAATFKRGMSCANIATTLLAAADAAVGGKTGVNFGGVKNAVGAFAMPVFTDVLPEAFATLPRGELLSGYGELLKMALIGSAGMLRHLVSINPDQTDFDTLARLARQAAAMKMEIVEKDPQEAGLRRILNFGHTAGHAIESLMLHRGKGVAHGVAVAWGIVVAMVLSRMVADGCRDDRYTVANAIVRPLFGPLPVSCDDYPELLSLMHSDKKHTGPDSVRFILLESPGNPIRDVDVSDDDITAAFDIARDMLS